MRCFWHPPDAIVERTGRWSVVLSSSTLLYITIVLARIVSIAKLLYLAGPCSAL
jgi:hypothetical protein